MQEKNIGIEFINFQSQKMLNTPLFLEIVQSNIRPQKKTQTLKYKKHTPILHP